MAKIITAYLSDLMQQHLQGAISFSRMVELLNEKAQEPDHPTTENKAVIMAGEFLKNYPVLRKLLDEQGFDVKEMFWMAMEEYRNT